MSQFSDPAASPLSLWYLRAPAQPPSQLSIVALLSCSNEQKRDVKIFQSLQRARRVVGGGRDAGNA